MTKAIDFIEITCLGGIFHYEWHYGTEQNIVKYTGRIIANVMFSPYRCR